jgi:hypothetical protein
MSKPITKKIKCRPKLDSTSIALIINYIERTQKSSPGLAITWGQLEKSFNYSRQALEKHEQIKLAYQSANAAASAHKNAPTANGDADVEPLSISLLKKRISKGVEEIRELKQQIANLLEFVAQLVREVQTQGISLAGMTGILPQEHHQAIFQMKPVTTPQADAEK